ncbi:2-phosphoglycolate phosphatase [Sistotremastrum niveocremeum HHB9708]|uniref:4-nitrophenylphosphatase n=2 Tax=Sistotremastraceae TaxID=3402574 RepID=A0A164YDS6_9AGAM|nr:2-phosphoglycolate phosphatase [Sistotremastrum niveocremeum HHB9708]KZT33925.1 2-phosphoglycolate phosphatase [Sistotremastrum suecicum HHB10207 ss-3]
MAPQRLSSAAEYKSLLENYDTWMFDCDGVLWHGDRLIDGALEVLSLLREQKKHIIFVTNNATKSRKNYKKKFDSLGVEASVEEIFGSAYAAAVYISSVLKLPKDEKVYVIGMDGIEQELAEEGVAFEGGTDPADNTLAPFSLKNFKPDPAISAVLIGLDTSINYTKLSKAFQYLNRPASEGKSGKPVHFLVTNQDPTYPAGDGLLPGAGSISAPLRYSLKKDPISLGKPGKTMLDCIQAKHHFDPARSIMIGDRLDTDILFGQAGGLSTLLVLTGVTQESEISGPDASPIVPDFVTASLGDLRAAI